MGVPARNQELPPRDRIQLEPGLTGRSKGVNVEAHSAVESFSLFVGGPVYDFLHRIGLVRSNLPNVLRRIAVLVALTWLPLLLLSLKDGLAFGHRVRIPLLYDFSTYGRFFLALPLLLLAEVMIDPAIRTALAEFLETGVLPDTEASAFTDILRRTQQLRDSWLPEFVLLAIAFFPVFLFQHEWQAGAVSSWHTTGQGLTPAGWWYAVFSTPLLRFIIYRWGFRYFVWSALLLRLSRLRLVLTPTHPDHAAGLGFLSHVQHRFGVLFCALGCAFAGRVANSLAFERMPLTAFRFHMVGFVVLSLILGLLPLTMLSQKLAAARRVGLLEYGRLAGKYTLLFDQEWVQAPKPSSQPLLGTTDIRSLASLGNCFGMVDAMTVAPITKRLVLQLGAQAAMPLVPVIILGTPTPELVNELLKMVV